MMREPKFVPKAGQVDYTFIRYCPTVNCVVVYQGKILMVKRSSGMRLYPNLWNGIAGFLDDELSVIQKAKEELLEELNIGAAQIESIRRGRVLTTESKVYKKTWIIFPVLVTVKTDTFKLDYEAQAAKWIEPKKALSLNLVPGFDKILAEFF